MASPDNLGYVGQDGRRLRAEPCGVAHPSEMLPRGGQVTCNRPVGHQGEHMRWEAYRTIQWADEPGKRWRDG